MAPPISPDIALDLVLTHVPPPKTVKVACGLARGRTLTENVVAPADVPGFARAMMDGYAVRAGDAGSWVNVVGTASAGHVCTTTVAQGCAVEIMTGAQVPPQTESVVMVEHTQRDGTRVLLPSEIRPGAHIQAAGELLKRDAVALAQGTVVTALGVAVLHALGRTSVSVVSSPRVLIVSTGDELRDPGDSLGPGEIFDSNGPMLASLAHAVGVADTKVRRAGDSLDSLRLATTDADAFDVILFSGGVSMGRFDLVPEVLQSLAVDRVFHKVAQKPGKPLLFAASGKKLVFGLPGNARSSHFCFARYVAPALRRWQQPGFTPTSLLGRFSTPYAHRSDRTSFVPALAHATGPGWTLSALPDRGSADIFGPFQANAYVRLEPQQTAVTPLDDVPFFLMDEFNA